jgi:transketolase
MRQQLCDSLVGRAKLPQMVFMTGDLGFMALEPLQEALGERFINAGVAEQNMVTVAAAMSSQGLEVWAYSIAPFIYARPFEQIRNDICFHNLPVKLIGNGGGYGYGVMGPTHHAIDDYGALLTLPGMTVFIPAFNEDVEDVVAASVSIDGPCYLRMGRGEPPSGWPIPRFAPWRQLTTGGGPVVIAVGPLAGSYIASFEAMASNARPNLWVISALPLERFSLPDLLLSQLKSTGSLCVAEEHVSQGSLAGQLMLELAHRGISVKHFKHLHALAHNYDLYGSQNYLRKRSALDSETMNNALGLL